VEKSHITGVRPALLLGLLALWLGAAAAPAQAGCGCAKPPPLLAQVRPNVAYAGTPVTLFSPNFRDNQAYTVTFTSGVSGRAVSVNAGVKRLRDLADGVYKLQLVVPLPDMPLGPASITATRAGQAVRDLFVDDSNFTVAPPPVPLPAQYGTWHYPNFQAAVGRDGVAYLALDASNIRDPMVFEAQAAGYPLRFAAQDVIFKNVQGFLMQLLVQGETNEREPVPGMFVLPAANPASDSDNIHYSRHEFTTYFLQHQERQPHAVDPSDGNWHLDGTRHVDHNHLILAIVGHLNDGATPAPGATPPFDLVTKTYSLFYQGLVGREQINMSKSSKTDSFDPASGLVSSGDVFTNGDVRLNDYAVVNGSATGAGFRVDTTAKITGRRIAQTAPASFMEVKVPALLPNLGTITLDLKASRTITGPGSFQVGDLILKGGSTLYVDNSNGPVTLYVTGKFTLTGNATIVVKDPNPEHFAIYVAGKESVTLDGGMTSRFYGVVYAPASTFTIKGDSDFYGAFVAGCMYTDGQARVHYYSALRGH